MKTTNLAFVLCLGWTVPAVATEVAVVGLFKDRVVVTIDGQRRVIAVGQSSPEGVKLISADTEGAVLEVDGAAARYKLGDEIGASYAAPAGKSVKLWPDGSGMYFVAGSINGVPVKFLVDTGATSVAMNSNEARRLGISYRLKGEQGAVETASGVARAWSVQLNSVKVGELQLTGVQAVVIDGDMPREVLLGNTFLSRVHMERDGQALLLRQTY
jgi:aspartyl protease family protein